MTLSFIQFLYSLQFHHILNISASVHNCKVYNIIGVKWFANWAQLWIDSSAFDSELYTNSYGKRFCIHAFRCFGILIIADAFLRVFVLMFEAIVGTPVSGTSCNIVSIWTDRKLLKGPFVFTKDQYDYDALNKNWPYILILSTLQVVSHLQQSLTTVSHYVN